MQPLDYVINYVFEILLNVCLITVFLSLIMRIKWLLFCSICLLIYNIYNKPNTPESVSRPSLSSPAISVAPSNSSTRSSRAWVSAAWKDYSKITNRRERITSRKRQRREIGERWMQLNDGEPTDLKSDAHVCVCVCVTTLLIGQILGQSQELRPRHNTYNVVRAAVGFSVGWRSPMNNFRSEEPQLCAPPFIILLRGRRLLSPWRTHSFTCFASGWIMLISISGRGCIVKVWSNKDATVAKTAVNTESPHKLS